MVFPLSRLMQVKVEREEFEEELKETRERLAATRQEMDQIRNRSADAEELNELRKVCLAAKTQTRPGFLNLGNF